MVAQSKCKYMFIPFVALHMPKFVAVAEDSINLCCFLALDIYLLYGGRTQAAWSCLHSPCKGLGLKGPILHTTGIPVQD